MDWLKPFSILCRIEWVATTLCCLNNANIFSFQYPVSDRMGCNNSSAESASASAQDLSVSCVGSNGLQRMESKGRYPDCKNFQYPVSDRMGCNNNGEVGLFPWVQLSVSCVGSNGLQLAHVRIMHTETQQLSVSCVGSNGLQRFSSRIPPGMRHRLSVSCVGSNGLQLKLRNGDLEVYKGFQYPVSDRMGCNVRVILDKLAS